MQPGIAIDLVGPWAETAQNLGAAPAKIMRAWRAAARPQIGDLRDLIRKQYRKAAPPIAETTRIIRRFKGFGGRKPLLVSGDLRNSVTLVRNGGDFFVGVLRKAGRKGGGLDSLANLAEIHEEGRTFAVPLTAKSRAFLQAAFSQKRAKKKRARVRGAGGRFVKSKGAKGGGKSNPTVNEFKNFVIVKIPARPVFAPAFAAWDAPKAAEAIATRMQEILFPQKAAGGGGGDGGSSSGGSE